MGYVPGVCWSFLEIAKGEKKEKAFLLKIFVSGQ